MLHIPDTELQAHTVINTTLDGLVAIRSHGFMDIMGGPLATLRSHWITLHIASVNTYNYHKYQQHCNCYLKEYKGILN